MHRLIWGENLENEMKCNNLDSDEFIQRHHSMTGSETIPFVLFYFKDGSGWRIYDYNNKGFELYGDSIMKEE